MADFKEIKEEFEELNKKLSELSEDELAQVSVGDLNKILHGIDNGDSSK